MSGAEGGGRLPFGIPRDGHSGESDEILSGPSFSSLRLDHQSTEAPWTPPTLTASILADAVDGKWVLPKSRNRERNV